MVLNCSVNTQKHLLTVQKYGNAIPLASLQTHWPLRSQEKFELFGTDYTKLTHILKTWYGGFAIQLAIFHTPFQSLPAINRFELKHSANTVGK